MKNPLIARLFHPVVSFNEENPYQPVKQITDIDRIVIYAKSTEFVGNFLEKLSRRKNHENNPPSQR
ncbi:hypothetical protein [Vibrio cholerae]|uniref:hypothetical protein n=1 Tax=Vibrio cholerae TaxID=666 RepID=UPI0022F31166|nr:hypothetical protein [Vibrio cholerae]MDA5316704.1 hypothetical protein [Vibrio cholerae]